MSTEALRWAKNQTVGGPTPKLILKTLADYANEDALAWPSRSTIAYEAEVSVDSVDRWLPKLEALGLITKQTRFAGDSKVYTSSIYQLNLDAGNQKRRSRPGVGSRNLRPPSLVIQPELDFAAQPAEDCGQGGRTDAARVAADNAATGGRTGAATKEPHSEQKTPTPTEQPTLTLPEGRAGSILDREVERTPTTMRAGSAEERELRERTRRRLRRREPGEPTFETPTTSVFIAKDSEEWREWTRYRKPRIELGFRYYSEHGCNGREERTRWPPDYAAARHKSLATHSNARPDR